MDPVGQEDDDVDNDGDSDSSDKYLKNRRKVVSKAIKQDEQVGARSAGMQRGGKMTYGVRDTEFKGSSPEQQSRLKSRYYQDKERQTRDAERERKQKQREKEQEKTRQQRQTQREEAPSLAVLKKKIKSGTKLGSTETASAKARGLIPRADGTKRKSPKYK